MSATHHLVTASRVEGQPVYTKTGEKLGKIDDLLIDKASGKTLYALMSFDGFLGLGKQYFPIPWAKLDYDPKKHGYAAALTRKQIEDGPKVAEEEVKQEIAWRETVHDYYQMAPYWV